MQHTLTDAKFCHDDGRFGMRQAAQPAALARAQTQSMSAAANVLATIWVIACLLLVWAAIVTA